MVPGVAKWISGEAAAPVVVATWPLCCSWAVALVVGAYCPGGGYDVAPMWQLGQCAGVCLGVLAPSKAAPGSLQVASFAERVLGAASPGAKWRGFLIACLGVLHGFVEAAPG